MKNVLNYFIGLISILTVIAIINGVINYFFLWENNGNNYYKNYIKTSREIKVKVEDKNFDEEFGHTHYIKYTIGYKGIMGGSRDYTFEDSYTQKYFKIMRFDLPDQSLTAGQNAVISGKDICIMVDIYEYNNPDYGTITNPIHVFSYKGSQKPLGVSVGAEGWQIIEPTQQEYEYNVINYLTYVMPAKEFKERFEKGK
ncbi:hypothetical protein ASF10_17070 [Flavobacterium sp. Leaf82]|jgi:hypothetical protein|uniref:hypothetical protein n=1 Tax=unclassified Flavobacterium TaxID=196869 RepID=UPI0007023442|nr:hypothetical protein [Flavobacterium sp. Leaf82]KQO20393.1 hypothetical protein ASF10_17070 [Flavobacterium sp. Leaf82]